MTWTDAGWLVIGWTLSSGVRLLVLAVKGYREMDRTLAANRAALRENRWNRLPSGWSKQYGSEVVGFVATGGTGPHWWVTRRGRTVIEGGAKTADDARREVESAVSWLT